MPRAIWTGSIAFGLVNIPIRLVPAISPKDVRFHQFDRETGARVRYRKVAADPAEPPRWSDADEDEASSGERAGRPAPPGRPTARTGAPREDPREGPPAAASDAGSGPGLAERTVDREDIVSGYEVDRGEYVMLTREEIEAARPVRSRTIEIEDFVSLEEIDPVYFEKSYWLVPGRDAPARKPYALLLRALEEAGRVGIGRFVLRSKEHLAAIRPARGVLGLETLFFADEVVPVPEAWSLGAGEPVRPREIQMALQLIESLATEWDPERYEDRDRARLLDLIREKAPTSVAPESSAEERPAPAVPDLMEALRASVEALKEGSADTGSSRAAPRPKKKRARGAG